LAVLPLENFSGNEAQDYLADGMTEALITRLSAIQGLRVISRTSVMQFKGTRKPVSAIAKELSVDAVVEGSVLRSGNQIRINIQLIRGATDEHLWSKTYDRELRDILALQSEVAHGIASEIETAVTGKARKGLVAPRTVSPDVYESYLKGRFALHKNSRDGVVEAVTLFKRAIDEDPTFAPAYAGLATAHHQLGTVFYGDSPPEATAKVMAAVETALELDPELVEARVVLADALQREWRWAEAEAEFKHALESNPSDALAHVGFARWLLCQGRTQEALAWAERGRELDPLALIGTNIGWFLFHARRNDEAIRELRSVLAIEPENARALWYLGFALIEASRFDEAVATLEESPTSPTGGPRCWVFGKGVCHAGHRREALRVLDELHRMSQAGYVPAAAFVNAYLGLGDSERAFVWLERASRERSSILQFLKVHPFFDPLRSDPRFAELLRRANLG
jgi:TolB-like protein/tetratricopeptide (TPR) repeat protein